jgi:predicted amidohydrolase
VSETTADADLLRVAAIQMTSGGDVERNHRVAERLVRRAAASGARVAVLPEKWHFIHDDRRSREAAESLDGPSTGLARDWAAELGLTIVAGSVIERGPDGRSYNTSVLIQPNGEVTAVYRKLHLFDVEVGGVSYRESDGVRPGDRIVSGFAAGRRIGLSICYDLRFPELYRRLALEGAELLAVPSAFTAATGRDHWEVLLRARAIENQAFVVAANQYGTHANGNRSYGRSMVVDPWGVVLAQAGDGEAVVLADLDFGRRSEIRARLPALGHRRSDVYGDPGPG